MISLNSNLSATNTANNLRSHYSKLQVSTQRLSSGLRINGSADDAAGLAIRELMRSDIAALNQGTRNANDAISMLQTFDGALSVIDEKLIRMKELAEQAATGTYDSTQRLMIDSEFQAMKNEIDRIARATDFNGIKILDGEYDKINYSSDVIINNINVISDNNNIGATINGFSIDGNKYVNKQNPDYNQTITITAGIQPITRVSDNNSRYSFVIDTPPGATGIYVEHDPDNGWTIRDDDNSYTRLTYTQPGDTLMTATDTNSRQYIDISIMDNATGNLIDMQSDINNLGRITTNPAGQITYEEQIVKLDSSDANVSYNENTQKIPIILKNGGTVNLDYNSDDGSLNGLKTITFDINIHDTTDYPDPDPNAIPNNVTKIHFGTGNDSAEDYYYIEKKDATIHGLGLENTDVMTQDNAQNALVDIKNAIIEKDKMRSYFGAMQNRLENTITNLTIQSENLQASESRISDSDVAIEMMNFVRNQILTQSAVAMLSQANSMPQMVMRLIG